MPILFYIIKREAWSLKRTYEFIIEFSKQVREQIIIIDENESGNISKDLLASQKNVSIIQINEVLDGYNIQQGGKGRLKFDNYLNYVGPELINRDKGGVAIYARKLYNILDDAITKYKVQAVHLCVFFEPFRSIGATILQKVITARNVPLYMIHKTPCKGRFCIYRSIYFNLKKTVSFYHDTLRSGLNENIRNDLDGYFSSYISFTNTTHYEKFKKKRKNRKKPFSVRKFKSIIKKMITLPEKKPERDAERPYILFLLNKPNHWISSFANPELFDRNYVIKTVWLNIPTGYDLVLKPHPGECFNAELTEIVQKMPNCYIDFQQIKSVELVKGAEAVVFSGTTSAIIALACKKHVIELGRKSIYFDFADPPAKRVQDLMDLGGVLEECLREEPPVDKIYAYFHALLQNSYPLHENGKAVALGVPEDMSERVAQVLVSRMIEDGVIRNGEG
jgi:hypothetical protein